VTKRGEQRRQLPARVVGIVDESNTWLRPKSRANRFRVSASDHNHFIHTASEQRPHDAIEKGLSGLADWKERLRHPHTHRPSPGEDDSADHALNGNRKRRKVL
jgi:hypothetical protein